MKPAKSKAKQKKSTKNKTSDKQSSVKVPKPFLLSTRRNVLNGKIQGMFDFMRELEREIATEKELVRAAEEKSDPDDMCFLWQYQILAKRHLENLFSDTFKRWRQRWFSVIAKKANIVHSKDLPKYTKEFTDVIDSMKPKKKISIPKGTQLKLKKSVVGNAASLEDSSSSDSNIDTDLFKEPPKPKTHVFDDLPEIGPVALLKRAPKPSSKYAFVREVDVSDINLEQPIVIPKPAPKYSPISENRRPARITSDNASQTASPRYNKRNDLVFHFESASQGSVSSDILEVPNSINKERVMLEISECNALKSFHNTATGFSKIPKRSKSSSKSKQSTTDSQNTSQMRITRLTMSSTSNDYDFDSDGIIDELLKKSLFYASKYSNNKDQKRVEIESDFRELHAFDGQFEHKPIYTLSDN